MRTRMLIVAIVMLGGWTFLGCGSDMSDTAVEGPNGASNDYGEEPGRQYSDASSSSDSYVPAQEEEMDFDFQAPQASEHYVYVAATARDSLVRINAETLDIRLIPVGGAPTQVATLPAGDVAVVLNSGTDDLSIVRSTEESDDVTTLEILPHLNTIEISPDGRHAIVFYNHKRAEQYDPVGDLQTILVISLTDGNEAVSRVSTGFHPTDVFFHDSLPMAYLITDDGVGILDLEDTQDGDITPVVAVADDLMEDPELREVVVTADGEYALVRNQGSASLGVVSLVDETIHTTQLPGIATDVDLVPGKHQALLVLREESLALVVDLEGLMAEEEDAVETVDISGTQAGAAVVSRDGNRAVLYSTVGGTKAVSVLDLVEAGHPWTAVPVQKTVVGVDISPLGTTAVIFHEAQGPTEGESDVDQTVAMSNGFTLFQLETGYRKLIQTEDPWTNHLFVSSQTADERLYVLTPDPHDVSHVLQSVDLDTFIRERMPMAARPESMVYVAKSGKVAVSQEHLNGRISFVDVSTDEVYSVTGYELNGMIH
mgnify:CR=1 FL=1